MPRLYLGLVLHNHQPVGNYGFVIDDLYHKAYLPMLEALERHPAVRVALHNSGPLIDWLEEHRPEYMERVGELVRRGQVEPVGGGYYEPVLPMISDADKAGQIRKLADFLEGRFGARPSGLWLTERVWEPGLPRPLAAAGVEWTLVDDAHFRMAGMRDDDLDGYFITEEQGWRVAIFVGSQRLRYTIPWLEVDDLVAELRARADGAARDGVYVVLGDDGEKFGGWPTTYEHVWEHGWIERFFSAVEQASDWLEVITPGAYMRRFPARGLVYLPAASYAEMMEWAMPPEASAAYHRIVAELESQQGEETLRFVRGGFWRFFLARYPEANAMHKRGVRIDAKVESAAQGAHPPAWSRVGTAKKSRARGKPPAAMQEAREALWRAQCNCPYWHGVFGGLYLRHIRAATNANLVQAERLADEATGAAALRNETADFDFDGRDEILLQTPDLSLLLHPHEGGALSEFDLRRRDHALLDVLARRREAYHEALITGAVSAGGEDVTSIHGGVRVKEAGLDERLVFDRHRRGGLQEWIIDAAADPALFSRGQAGAMFEPDGAWDAETREEEGAVAVRLTREHDGWRIAKEAALPAEGERLDVRYTVTNATGERRSARFVSEWNISAPHAPDGDDRIARLEAAGRTADASAETGAIEGVTSLLLRGSADWGIGCETDAPVDAWHFPVQTVSSSEGGLELVYQGASVSITRLLDLDAGDSTTLALTWRVVEP